MEHFIIQQRECILKTFYQNNGSIITTSRRLSQEFDRDSMQSGNCICNLMIKFEDLAIAVAQRSGARG